MCFQLLCLPVAVIKRIFHLCLLRAGIRDVECVETGIDCDISKKSNHLGAYYVAVSTILICSALFVIFMMPWYISLMHERGELIKGLLILLVQSYFGVASLFWIMKTKAADPGLIPKKVPLKTDPLHPKDDESLTPEERIKKLDQLYINPPKRFVTLRKGNGEEKWCYTCHLWRPIRSSHCDICDGCVELHDHHCPWIGNCVGKRNYKFFVFFLYDTFLALLGMTIICCNLFAHDLVANKLGKHAALEDLLYLIFIRNFVTVLLIIAGILIGWSVFGLAVYHTYIMYIGKTTREQMRGLHGAEFSNGLENIYLTMCAPNFPSYPPNLMVPTRSPEERGLLVLVDQDSDDDFLD